LLGGIIGGSSSRERSHRRGWVVGHAEAMICSLIPSRVLVNRALTVRLPQEIREFTPFGVGSLFPEGDDRVDAGSAESGDVAGREGNAEEEGGDGPESNEVSGLDAIEHGA
jgi:hypothetical protein